jgi:catechol 2,3-dioxygenase-like lactoylglutathione lyase family enzyme
MKQMNCTHFVLYVKNLAATRHFYVDELGCVLRRFSREEKFLSIAVGNFIINFDSKHQVDEGYTLGIAHVGFEVENKDAVDTFADYFESRATFRDKRNTAYGPYRFYVYDPDGYTIEIHTWEGVEEGN